MLELFKQYNIYAIIVVSYFLVPPGRVVTHAEGGWVFKLAAECRETLGPLDSYQILSSYLFKLLFVEKDFVHHANVHWFQIHDARDIKGPKNVQ